MSTRKVNGAAVKAIREKARMKGSQLAVAAGMSHAALINIESGRRQASPERTEALAAALDVDIEAITYEVAPCPICSKAQDAA
jgi:transcriptional regulator with XRE-family HTH domain